MADVADRCHQLSGVPDEFTLTSVFVALVIIDG